MADTTTASRGPQLDRAALAARLGYSKPGTITKLQTRARARRAAIEASGLKGRKLKEALDDPSLFPEPDGYLGRTPYWLVSTADRFQANKLGRGMAPAPAGGPSGAGNLPGVRAGMQVGEQPPGQESSVQPRRVGPGAGSES